MPEPRARVPFDLGDYVPVNDRIKRFYELFAQGRLVTAEVRVSSEPDGVPRVLVQALAYRTPDDPLPGVGWSWMQLPGSTTYTRGSELENTETSAWGRAIGSLGILIDRSIASANEVASKQGEVARQQSAQAAMRADEPEPLGDFAGTGSLVINPNPPADGLLRQSPQGPYLIVTFAPTTGRKIPQVVVRGTLASDLYELAGGALAGLVCTVEGDLSRVSWRKDGRDMPPYERLELRRITTVTWSLPRPSAEDELDALLP